MKEANLLIYPKPKTKEEEKKEKKKQEEAKAAGKPAEVSNEPVFTEVEVMNSIGNVNSFDQDMLDYYNFLECVLRVA